VALIENDVDVHAKDTRNVGAMALVSKPDIRAVMQEAAARMAQFWTVHRHHHFGVAAHRCVVTVLLCNGRAGGAGVSGVPWLPTDVWLILERRRRREMGLPLSA